MKTKFIIVSVLIIAAAFSVGVFLIQEKPEKENGGSQDSPEKALKAWIDVVKPAASELEKEREMEVRRLLTGDELGKGALVKTDQTGFGDIYFPGGSVLRLDSETKVVLEDESFEPQNKKLTVRIFLAGGRVWSKVLELATPESLWEVRTSNTLAAVRGTAFSVEYFQGKTKIIGAEGEVLVQVIDPETQKIIKGSDVLIAPNKFIEIKNEDIENIKKNPEITSEKVKDVPEKIQREGWIKRAMEADKEVERMLKENPENFEEAIKEEKIEKTPDLQIPPGTEQTTETKPAQQTPSQISQPPSEKAAAPVKLILENETNLTRIEEGTRIYFKAFLLMDNNEKTDVTAFAQWQVLGGVGAMEKPGLFLAKLDQSLNEQGLGFGTVVAVWKDEKSQDSFLAKSPVLQVAAKTEGVIEQIE